MLQIYIDDSKSGEDVLVLAGYIGLEVKWDQFSLLWKELLDEHPKWDEFKMRRAIRHPERVQKFYQIIKEHVAAYVACVVEIQSLRRLCEEFALPHDFRNPYIWALKALPWAIYAELGEVGLRYPIEFIFDDRGEKRRVQEGWPYFCLGLPQQARRLIKAEPRFEKSHEFLPLQSAEIVAWHTRKHWLRHKRFHERIELSWAEADPIKGLIHHWDYDALEPNFASLRESLARQGYPLSPLQES